METTERSTPNTADNPDASQSERRPGSPGSPDAPPRPRLLAALAGLLLLFVIAMGLLLLVSLFVVYTTGLAARWLGLPELHVTLAFLGLLALVVVSFVGARIGSEIEAVDKRIEAAIEDAGDRIADEVTASAFDLTDAINELPVVVVVEPEIAPRVSEGRVGPAGTVPPGSVFPRKKPPRHRRR